MGILLAKVEGGRLIIVSGASGGIGRAVLPGLADLDRVIGLYNNKLPPLQKNTRIKVEKVNLMDEKEIRIFVDKNRRELERITIVHFAAKSVDKLAVHCEVSDWNDVMNINLRGNFLLSRSLIPLMIRQRWGRIIHISSVVGMAGIPGTVAYATSKTGLIGLSRVLAKEYARFNITSNVLCLGYFEVGLIETLNGKTRQKILSQIPSRQLGKIASISNSVRWLIDSDYVNGAVINIDGGI